VRRPSTVRRRLVRLSREGRSAHLPFVSPYSSATDSELLRIARTDADAFAEFYRLHADVVYRSVARRVESPDAALEITAEAFAHALRLVGRFRGARPESGAAWIQTIAASLAKQQQRTHRVQSRARERLGITEERWSAFDDGEIEQRLDALAAGGRLERLLGELPASQRAVVQMRVVGDASYDEIATILGVTPATARQQLHRGLAHLRERLDAIGGTP
jgi:RNA polymerase sigma factor (sigma-70 family)